MSLARERSYSFSSSSSSSTVALGVCTSWVLLTRWALLPNGTYRTYGRMGPISPIGPIWS